MTYSLGIDLGTTYTAACVADADGLRMAGLAHDRVAVPSVIAAASGGLVVGEEALAVTATAPWNVAKEFKRRFGDPTPLIFGDQQVTADALTTRLLGWVVNRVTELEGSPPSQVVLTHPATWGEFKLDLLRQGAESVGLAGVSLLSEPAAAAVHYHDRNRVPDGGCIAVYDLGGGTFDVAVLERDTDGYHLRGQARGLDRVGGVDLDEVVFQHVISAIGDQINEIDHEDPVAIRAAARLREECVRAKIGLSYDTSVVIPVLLPGVVTEVLIQRSEFERAIWGVLDETVAVTAEAIESAGLTPKQLYSVLLVGGSSRVPLVTQRLTEGLGLLVVVDSHPKQSVAMGAALSVLDRRRDEPEVATVEPQMVPDPTIQVDIASLTNELTRQHIIVLSGERAGRLIELPEGTTILGRDDREDIVGLGNPRTSRRHVAVTRRGSSVTASDLRSTNGTLVEGVPLTEQDLTLEQGTILDIANTLVLIDGPGARLDSVAALSQSGALPEAPSSGRLRRLRRRGSEEQWLGELSSRVGPLRNLTVRISRARRYQQPSGALLKYWQACLPGRIVERIPTDATYGSVVIGYADLPSLLNLNLPTGLSRSTQAEAEALLGRAALDPLVPLSVPLLHGVTVLVSADSAGLDLVRSMCFEFQTLHPQEPLTLFGLPNELRASESPSVRPDGGLVVIDHSRLSQVEVDEAGRAAQAASGSLWLLSSTDSPINANRLISVGTEGGTYQEPADSPGVSFTAATLSEPDC